MSIIAENILAIASKLFEGEIISPKDFLHLGSRMAIDQTLSRLVKQDELIRVGRGMYVLPVTGHFGTHPPAVEKTVQSLALKTGETIVSHGAAAANVLGLTTQVPIRQIFLTGGANRKFYFNSLTVELKHVPHWQLLCENMPAGMAIRALAWMGKSHIEKSLEKLYKNLPQEEWRKLYSVRSSLPSWMAESIGKANARMSIHG